jgi:hypothetical protein
MTVQLLYSIVHVHQTVAERIIPGVAYSYAVVPDLYAKGIADGNIDKHFRSLCMFYNVMQDFLHG